MWKSEEYDTGSGQDGFRAAVKELKDVLHMSPACSGRLIPLFNSPCSALLVSAQCKICYQSCTP